MALAPELLDPRTWSYLAGALLQVVIAAWILFLAPGDPRHRAFSVLVACNAAADVADGFTQFATGAAQLTYARVFVHVQLWTTAALFVFLALYPARRAWSRPFAIAGVVAFLAADALFLLRPELVSPAYVGGEAVPGPLRLATFAFLPLTVLGSVLILRDVRAHPPSDFSPYVVALALNVYAASNLVFSIRSLRETPLAGALDGILAVGALVAAVAALFVAVYVILQLAFHPHAGAPVVYSLAAAMLAIVAHSLWPAFGAALPGFNALLFGLLVAYALARARLFDIDLKLKASLRRGSVAGAFVLAFFVVSQIAQNWLSNYGIFAGGAAAGLMLFAVHPIQRAADRIAERVMPNVIDTPEYVGARKLAVYRAALEGALADDSVTAKERDTLRRLQLELGIANADAAALEHEIRQDRAAA